MDGEDDYDAILSAVRETERGRWFLDRHAALARGEAAAAGTAAVLDALARLERRLAAGAARALDGASPGPDLAGVIEALRADLAALKPAAARTGHAEGEDALDAAVATAERATLALAAALAGGAPGDLDLGGAFALQAVSVRRMRAMAGALRELETRLGAPAAAEPAPVPSPKEGAPSRPPLRATLGLPAREVPVIPAPPDEDPPLIEAGEEPDDFGHPGARARLALFA